MNKIYTITKIKNEECQNQLKVIIQHKTITLKKIKNEQLTQSSETNTSSEKQNGQKAIVRVMHH